jgi:hypothetical protein
MQPSNVQRRPELMLAAAVVAGAFVAVLAGVYGNVHDPASETTVQFFFSTTLHMKAWMTTLALALAVLQVLSALWMWGRLPLGDAPSWIGPVHRLLGTLTLVATLPVAYHCLWSLGFESDIGQSRRFWHSVFGCAFYGAFATKVISVRSHRMPSWALPVVGGTVFTLLVLLWLTSSLWFFDNVAVEL